MKAPKSQHFMGSMIIGKTPGAPFVLLRKPGCNHWVSTGQGGFYFKIEAATKMAVACTPAIWGGGLRFPPQKKIGKHDRPAWHLVRTYDCPPPCLLLGQHLIVLREPGLVPRLRVKQNTNLPVHKGAIQTHAVPPGHCLRQGF